MKFDSSYSSLSEEKKKEEEEEGETNCAYMISTKRKYSIILRTL